ncbi:D-hexose-6-phosphate mutarotase [uncultured Ferrimonas sp.]|uniref:D-hexose-6-phosphate mutarotase n=1 Tax=uncultured Ferrimonas sp. TaxID=432640 RepID=UPI00262DB81B|nr:D-hexose-6-phosphate mutarotase [uncultured Ferrimonas sp.]
MERIQLSDANQHVEISLFGGHVLRWQAGDQSVLWLSELADLSGSSAIRGGVPICFPWFAEQGSPKHGFARTQRWQLQQHSQHHAVLVLRDNDTTLAIWPHKFELTLTVTLAPHRLELDLRIHNRDSHSWHCGGALHSYFNCHDARQIELPRLAERPYFDSLQQGQARQFDCNILPNPIDAIVPDLAEYQLECGQKLAISQHGSDSCVIWNPAFKHPNDVSAAQAMQFICLESAIARQQITLAPGQSHHLQQQITLC